MRMNKAATRPAVVRTLALAEDALRLRGEGKSIRQIADVLGTSPATIHRVLSDAIAEHRSTLAETATEMRELELQRLDRLTQINSAIAEDENRSDSARMSATDRLLRIMERRAKIMGLDTPDKLELEISDSVDRALSTLAMSLSTAVRELNLGSEIADRLFERVAAAMARYVEAEETPSARLLEFPST